MRATIWTEQVELSWDHPEVIRLRNTQYDGPEVDESIVDRQRKIYDDINRRIEIYDDINSRIGPAYRIIKAQNFTTYLVDDVLTREQVDKLIDQQVTVNITAPKE